MGRVIHEYDPEDPVEDFTPLPFEDAGNEDTEPEGAPV